MKRNDRSANAEATILKTLKEQTSFDSATTLVNEVRRAGYPEEVVRVALLRLLDENRIQTTSASSITLPARPVI